MTTVTPAPSEVRALADQLEALLRLHRAHFLHPIEHEIANRSVAALRAFAEQPKPLPSSEYRYSFSLGRFVGAQDDGVDLFTADQMREYTKSDTEKVHQAAPGGLRDEPVTPAPMLGEIWMAFGEHEGRLIALPEYAAVSTHAVKEKIGAIARREGYTGTVGERLMALGWRILRVTPATPHAERDDADAGGT